jgi:alpha-ribazole phosphatase
VRHGVAEGQGGRVVGHTDPPLSERGRADIASLLTSDPELPVLLLSSDLRRASQSAEILAAHWGIEVVTDARLRELHFGEWENRTWKDLEREDGARLNRWMRDWITTRTPGGESFTDLVARVSGLLAEYQETMATDTIVILAHAGSIRAILCRLLNVPFEQAFQFEVQHARVTGLDLCGASPNLICQNADTWLVDTTATTITKSIEVEAPQTELGSEASGFCEGTAFFCDGAEPTGLARTSELSHPGLRCPGGGKGASPPDKRTQSFGEAPSPPLPGSDTSVHFSSESREFFKPTSGSDPY